MGHFFWFPLAANHLALPCLVYLRALPCVHAHLLAEMDSREEAYGNVDIAYYGVALPPFLTPEEPFYACVVGKVSITSRTRNMWSLSFLATRHVGLWDLSSQTLVPMDQTRAPCIGSTESEPLDCQGSLGLLLTFPLSRVQLPFAPAIILVLECLPTGDKLQLLSLGLIYLLPHQEPEMCCQRLPVKGQAVLLRFVSILSCSKM